MYFYYGKTLDKRCRRWPPLILAVAACIHAGCELLFPCSIAPSDLLLVDNVVSIDMYMSYPWWHSSFDCPAVLSHMAENDMHWTVVTTLNHRTYSAPELVLAMIQLVVASRST